MKIAEASELPIILYNVPSRTGVNLGMGLLRRLSESEKIVGIKEASDSADRLAALSELGDKLPLYAGNDSQLYTTLALGGKGVISVVSNLYPEKMTAIFKAFVSGELKEARRLQFELLPLISALFTETNPAPVKYAASLLGICESELRLPLFEVRESTKNLIKELIL